MTAAHATLLLSFRSLIWWDRFRLGSSWQRLKGSIRKAGSGNIGATNVGRLLGGKFFAIVFTLDLLKGLVPMLAAAGVLAHFTETSREYTSQDYALWLLVGFSAITGHMFSIFLNFKGGKGVATSTGVILGLFPYYTLPAIVAILAFVVVFKLTRYVSLASIIGSGLFSVAYLTIGLALHWPVFGHQWPLLAFAVLMGGLIIYKHRGNLARLRAGTENRIGTHG